MTAKCRRAFTSVYVPGIYLGINLNFGEQPSRAASSENSWLSWPSA
jgi:hypothetical protein